MKKSLLIAIFGLLALALTVPAAYAAGTGTLSGKAVRWNGDPISGATIRALAGPLETDKEVARTTTGADGSYTLTVPTGQAYWIHIDTFGSWWGYSYQTPFTLSEGETVSQIYFALGPRDVKEITLPVPVSNTPSAPPTVTLPTETPVVAPTATPVSQVLPEVGSNNPPPAKPSTSKPAPVHSVPHTPATLPQTGAPAVAWPLLALALAGLLLVPAGLALRRRIA